MYNGQQRKTKWTNDDLQHTTEKTKNIATQNPL